MLGKQVKNRGELLLLAVLVLVLATPACGEPTPEPTETPTAEPTPAAGDTQIRATDSMVLVYVPSGTFQMGSTDAEIDAALAQCEQDFGDVCERSWYEDESPQHSVSLDDFWIDQTEVTNAQYRQCVEEGGCDAPGRSSSETRDSYYGNSAYDDYPVIYVSWYQADAYCNWAGARLLTEAEWEYAARGPEGRLFPWGDTFDGTRLNYCDVNCQKDWADEAADDGYADTAPVGSYPSGASWCGALDMAGNVWEWTSSRHESYPYKPDDGREDMSASGFGVARGGSWLFGRELARCAFRFMSHPRYSLGDYGFRCVSPVS